MGKALVEGVTVEEPPAAAEALHEIPLERLLLAKGNRTNGYDETRLEELAASMREVGVLVPLIVRPHGELYEIVAGHRRVKAAKLAGLATVPCRVRVYTDDEARAAGLIDNLQRDDLHPMDEAGDFAALRDKHGFDVPTIAAKVGKTEGYVTRALSFLALAPKVQEAFRAGHLTREHARLIARLQPEQQMLALKDTVDKRGKEVYVEPVNRLRNWIAHNCHLDLNEAAFPKDDVTLLPAAGPCTTCPKRTGCAKLLFEDIAKEDVCTDPTCFHAKRAAFVERRRLEVEREHGKCALVSPEHAYNTELPKPAQKGVQFQSYDKGWRAASPKTQGAKPAVVVEGKDAGKTVWVAPDSGRNGGGGLGGRKLSDAQKEKNWKEKHESSRVAEIEKRVAEAVLAKVTTFGLEDLRLVTQRFWRRLWHDRKKEIAADLAWDVPKPTGRFGGGRDYDGFGAKLIEAMNPDELHRFQLRMVLRRDDEELPVLAARVGVDVAGIKQAVKDEWAVKLITHREKLDAAEARKDRVKRKPAKKEKVQPEPGSAEDYEVQAEADGLAKPKPLAEELRAAAVKRVKEAEKHARKTKTKPKAKAKSKPAKGKAKKGGKRR